MTDHPLIGVGVFILRPGDNHILMGHRTSRHGQGSWGPAGGHVEFGEDPLYTVHRETKEETGIDIPLSSFSLLGITSDLFTESHKHYITLFYVAPIPAGAIPQRTEPDKFDAWEWFDLQQLPNNLFLPIKNLIQNMGGTVQMESAIKECLAQKGRLAATLPFKKKAG